MQISGCCTHYRPPPLARGLPSFEDLDADASGGISLDEYTEAAKTRRHGHDPNADKIAKRFAKIDTDADGSLTSQELPAFRAGFRPETGNALLGAQEGDRPSLEDRLADLFAQLDADGDGALSLSELVAAVKNLPGGRNDRDEEASAAAAETGSDGSDGAATDAADATAVATAVEGDATAETGDESGDGTTDSPRERWRARLESWSERFGDAWRDRFADRAERWHDRWAGRLADRSADAAEGRHPGNRSHGSAGPAQGSDVAGALHELVSLLRQALGVESGAGSAGTDTADTGSSGTATGGTDAAATTAETGASADADASGADAGTVALGDAAIDRLAALLASRIEAYLDAGTQNAAAGTTVSATA